MVGQPAIAMKRDVLQSWLKVSGYTRARLARELNVSKGRISQLLHSEEEPSARLIAGLLHLTDLPFDRLFAVKYREAMVQHMQRLSRQRRRLAAQESRSRS